MKVLPFMDDCYSRNTFVSVLVCFIQSVFWLENAVVVCICFSLYMVSAPYSFEDYVTTSELISKTVVNWYFWIINMLLKFLIMVNGVHSCKWIILRQWIFTDTVPQLFGNRYKDSFCHRLNHLIEAKIIKNNSMMIIKIRMQRRYFIFI